MKCHLCETRRPRRFCPGVRGDICGQCCGAEREVTVSCPLDCEYLLEARQHEKLQNPDPGSIPNRDIKVTEEFLNRNDRTVSLMSRFVLDAALNTPGAADQDIGEALEAMVKTYRTRQSGLIYETRPQNPLAGAIQQAVTANLAEFQLALQRESAMSTLRDADILGVLVFLQRAALHWNNQRPRGRSFISFLLTSPAGEMSQPRTPSLLLP